MFRLIVMQNQWLMMALLGGLALIGAVVLWYLDLWRQREPAGQGGALDQAPLRRWIRFMPWLLIWLYVVALVWAVAYVLRMAGIVPNW